MKFKFEGLVIWQKGMNIGEEMNGLSKTFLKDELYNLSSQLKRATDSIALNISEGSILQSGKEYRKFLGYAIRSLAEVVTCLHKANRRSYLIEDKFNEHYKACFNLMNMMIAFRNKIKD